MFAALKEGTAITAYGVLCTIGMYGNHSLGVSLHYRKVWESQAMMNYKMSWESQPKVNYRKVIESWPMVNNTKV